MPITDPTLWTTIRDWPLPFREVRDDRHKSPRTCRSFQDNLRMASDLTEDAAERDTTAYRKFLYLKALSGEVLAPSRALDMAWHLHMGFSDDYDALCGALGRDIPHKTGLPHDMLAAAYDRGRALRASEFDTDPPRDVWPSRDDSRAVASNAWIGGTLVLSGIAVCIGSQIVGLIAVFLAGCAMLGAGLLYLIIAGYDDGPRNRPRRQSEPGECG